MPPARADHIAAGKIPAQLTALPSICLSFNNGQESTDAGQSNYPNGVPVSVEFIDPANPAAYFQEGAGATVSGNHSAGKAKKSWSLRFRKAFTLNGTSGVTGPAAADGFTSAIFPGSPVRGFSRLLLRNQSGNSWHWAGEPRSLYFSDAYMKETDRALGNLTAQRRWTHCWVNGVYWGLYDLEEFMDADWLSRHLNAQANPPTAANPSPPAVPSLAASQLTFYSPSSDAAPTDWTELQTAATNAATDPSASVRDAAWTTVQSKLDLTHYMDYVLMMATVMNDDTGNNYQFRAWRDPMDGKWRLTGWDGDKILFRYGGMNHNQTSDGFLSSKPDLPADSDLALHKHLKQIPAYQEAFSARLALRIKSSSAVSNPPLSESAILARFDAQAAQVRSVLECEAMRWIEGGNDTLTLPNPDGIGTYDINKSLHLLQKWGEATLTARAAAAHARKDIKDEAREGRLLNDIPPPTITGSGNNFTITNPSGVGRIYFEKSTGVLDPKLIEVSPAITPPSTIRNDVLYGGETTVTARVYSTDLDGEAAWSAPTVYIKP